MLGNHISSVRFIWSNKILCSLRLIYNSFSWLLLANSEDPSLLLNISYGDWTSSNFIPDDSTPNCCNYYSFYFSAYCYLIASLCFFQNSYPGLLAATSFYKVVISWMSSLRSGLCSDVADIANSSWASSCWKCDLTKLPLFYASSLLLSKLNRSWPSLKTFKPLLSVY